MAELNPQPLPPVRNSVRIYVSRDIAYDLKKMHTVTANILGRLGCLGCHSGYVLEFQTIAQFAVNPATLEPVEIAGAQL